MSAGDREALLAYLQQVWPSVRNSDDVERQLYEAIAAGPKRGTMNQYLVEYLAEVHYAAAMQALVQLGTPPPPAQLLAQQLIGVMLARMKVSEAMTCAMGKGSCKGSPYQDPQLKDYITAAATARAGVSDTLVATCGNYGLSVAQCLPPE